MCTDELQAKLDTTPERKTIVLFGIEAHVCVQQTALDLLEKGYDVHILVDGVSSSRALERGVALRRMAQAGAYLTTAESLIFMLVGSAGHPQFRAISGLIKEHGQVENPFNEIANTTAAL
jgi:isochorismate hydrolase